MDKVNFAESASRCLNGCMPYSLYPDWHPAAEPDQFSIWAKEMSQQYRQYMRSKSRANILDPRGVAHSESLNAEIRLHCQEASNAMKKIA